MLPTGQPVAELPNTEASKSSFHHSVELYRQFVNPLWLDVLSDIGLLREFVSGEGAYLIDDQNNRFLDLVAGFGAAALGHANPYLCATLAESARSTTPGILPWGFSPEAGRLAARLCNLARAPFTKVHFASGGAEAVDAALKFAAAVTGRDCFLAFDGGFHGLTVATTGLSAGVWSQPFPRIWPAVVHVQPSDASAIDAALARHVPAAVVLEIVQGTGGAPPWDAVALAHLAASAKSSGALIIVDEVMSGLGRTGEWYSFSRGTPDFTPDIVVVSKVLTGGLVPVSAVLMREEIFQAVFADRPRAKIHGSTFSGAHLGMACGHAVLDIIERDELLANVRRRSAQILDGIRTLSSRGLLAGVFGNGLLLALDISHGDPQTRASAASATCLGLMERGVLTYVAAHDPGLLRLTPPFILDGDDVSLFLNALEDALTEMRTAE
jgi:ornithine--oxo-acid transaminase